jgi:rod shape determining protein RodA
MYNQQRSLFFNVDWVTIFIYLALCIIGWFNIHSAVYDPLKPGFIALDTNYGKQFLFIISSLILAVVILLLDSKFFITFSFAIYAITIVLLVLVLLIGRNVAGNQAWIAIGSFRLQPSEFAKFSTCLILARYLSSNTIKVQDFRTQAMCGLIILVPMILIMRQPDVGSTLVFCSMIFVLYREGLSSYFLIIIALFIFLFILTLLIKKVFLISAIVALTGLLAYMFRRKLRVLIVLAAGFVICILFVLSVSYLYNEVLKQHQKVRIDTWLGISNDLKGIGYNVNQSKIAIGAGQLWGRGYLKGTQTKYDFVPEQSTDFIFCTIGEEWGFVGCSVVIGLYLFLLLRIIHIAERQRSAFSRIYGYGVASIIFFHFFINIGMTVGLVPVIGIPLPFVSYGGSSLWSFTILLFILLKRDSNRMGII